MRSSTFAAIAMVLATLAAGHASAQDKLEAGRKLFKATAPACALCHTLNDAGAAGEIGPNLDELKPDASRVEKAVRNGIGQMPAFTNLSDAQIYALAEYIKSVTSAAK